MEPRNKNNRQSIRIIAICLLVTAVFVAPSHSNSQTALIPIGECELNGFPLGGTADEMREALGEPDLVSSVMTLGDEYPHLEYRYDGLHIVFSMHGRTALSYFVTSDKYRLRSGVGVGSTRQEIENALGPTGYFRSGGIRFMVYHLMGPDGRPVPVQLDIKLDGDIAVEFSLISR